jgi:hypothetical protein
MPLQQEHVTFHGSSLLKEASYDKKGNLTVQFHNTPAFYVYKKVPVETWEEFKTAPSAGKFYNQSIKGQFDVEKEAAASVATVIADMNIGESVIL